MNIKHYLSCAAALGLLAACSEYDPGLSDQAVNVTDSELEVIKEYEANFVEEFGEIDPNHTWGFPSAINKGTRLRDASGRGNELSDVETGLSKLVIPVYKNNDPSTNYIEDYTTGIKTYSSWTSAATVDPIKVPGFPSVVDGQYYVYEGDNSQLKSGPHSLDELTSANNHNKQSYAPAGDVTEEEILYVSNWFRTNRYPGTDVPPFKEFFAQDVSATMTEHLILMVLILN